MEKKTIRVDPLVAKLWKGIEEGNPDLVKDIGGAPKKNVPCVRCPHAAWSVFDLSGTDAVLICQCMHKHVITYKAAFKNSTKGETATLHCGVFMALEAAAAERAAQE